MSDVVVIGGGHNGLVAAAVLARAGREVTLLEARDVLGGRCAPVPICPGFEAPGLLEDTSTFRAEIDGVTAIEYRTGRKTIFDSADPVVERFRPAIRQLLDEPPPPLAPRGGDLWQLGKLGLALRRLGRRDMLELLRVLPMSVADWLGEHVDDPLEAEKLAYPAVMGGFFGPRAAGTAAALLFHECVKDRPVEGGAPALVRALEGACREAGVQLRAGTAVQGIRVRRGRVAEVVLQGGETLATGTVLACCHPRTVVLDLLHPADLPVRLEDQARCIRTRGTAAKVHLALRSPLEPSERWPAEDQRLLWGGDGLEGLERTFDAAKYGEISRPLLLDLSRHRCSDGEVVSIWAHCVPYRADEQWNRQARGAVEQEVRQRLRTLDPAVEEKVEAVQVLTPRDLEREFGLVGGQIFHVERTLDQSLMLRPCALLARYRTPIDGLYLGGAGCHPGGEISGMPGWLGANTMMSDE